MHPGSSPYILSFTTCFFPSASDRRPGREQEERQRFIRAHSVIIRNMFASTGTVAAPLDQKDV